MTNSSNSLIHQSVGLGQLQPKVTTKGVHFISAPKKGYSWLGAFYRAGDPIFVWTKQISEMYGYQPQYPPTVRRKVEVVLTRAEVESMGQLLGGAPGVLGEVQTDHPAEYSYEPRPEPPKPGTIYRVGRRLDVNAKLDDGGYGSYGSPIHLNKGSVIVATEPHPHARWELSKNFSAEVVSAKGVKPGTRLFVAVNLAVWHHYLEELQS